MSNVIATKAKTGRDSRVEILRLIACFAVLVLHFKPNTFVNGQRVLARTFVTCICTDAVGIFLLITGFFFFRNRKYTAKLADCGRKILLPTMIYTVFVAFIYPLLSGLTVDWADMAGQLATSIFTWNPIIHNAQHLWYMYLYCIIVAVYPLLNVIKTKLLAKNRYKAVFLLGTFALLYANDCTNNNMLRCDMVPLTVFIPGCLFVIAGGIIYQHRSRFEGKLLPFIAGVAMFTAINITRSIHMQKLLNTDATQTHLYGWYTSAGFLCAVSLAVAVLSIRPFTVKTINFISSTTMDVYILHPLISEIITILGYKSWVITTFLNGRETTVQFLKFTVIYCISVFAACGAISVVLKKAVAVLKHKLNKTE
ncbi:MAG: acyltransferase [Ruminococcaceae bacterium]|nr:acyltransferase [Oscillospiraceae bacterium]